MELSNTKNISNMYNFDDAKRIKPLRTVSNYSLVQKGNNFYIDNGIDDVSEYFDCFKAYHFETMECDEFLQECENLFN